MSKTVELLNKIKNLVKENDSYFETIPKDIRHILYENTIAHNLGLIIDNLITFEFAPSEEIVFEWLYNKNSQYYNLQSDELIKVLDEDWQNRDSSYQ